MSELHTPPTPAPSSGTSTGSNTGAAVTLEQLAAIVAALAGSVQTFVQQSGQSAAQQGAAQQLFQTQIADGFKSIDDNLQKLSNQISNQTQTDTDSGYVVRGASNPMDDQARMQKQRDEVGTVALQMLTGMVTRSEALLDEYLKYTSGVWTRSLDHFGSLPPIAPRSPTGPGTTAG